MIQRRRKQKRHFQLPVLFFLSGSGTIAPHMNLPGYKGMVSQMDSRPIGVFDSGLGGLTTVKKLMEYLPEEDIIYLGDTGRVPYGSRSRETIIKYALQDAAFLAGFNIKAMVIACNTACSVAYDILGRIYDMPVYEVIRAPSEAAAALTKNDKVGIIGTSATIRSGAYEAALKSIKPELRVIPVACPLFVPLVENGRTAGDDTAALIIAEDYLSLLREARIDTLILGCTHYPLLYGVISKVMGPGVELVDSGTETAKLVARDLLARDMLSPLSAGVSFSGPEPMDSVAEVTQRAGKGVVKYFVTDSTDGFSDLASRYLESDMLGIVEQVTLE